MDKTLCVCDAKVRHCAISGLTGMVVRPRFCCSWIFIVWILLTIIVGSQNIAIKIDSKASLVYVSTGLDVKLFPSRNSGLLRKYEWKSQVLPCLKCVAGLKFGNITFCAAYLVLLSGDIMTYPGPTKDLCTVCSKGCRKNQKAIQCDSCDGWFHVKCINMKTSKYSRLCYASMAWE